MNKKHRLNILKLSQTTPATPTTAVIAPVVIIDIRAVPNFNSNLFSISPTIINDINNVVNIINKHMSNLSNGKITFNMVWQNPSITGSEFSNSVKNLLNIAKWLYNVIKSRSLPYSLDALKALANGLITTVKSYSFPEPTASTIQSELMTAGQNMLAKLG